MSHSLIASESVVFRSFVRDLLAHWGVSSVPAASPRILKERMEQSTVDAIFVDGRRTPMFEEMRTTLRHVLEAFPKVRILVVGPEIEGIPIDFLNSGPLEDLSVIERDALAHRIEGWLSQEKGAEVRKKSAQRSHSQPEPTKRDSFTMSLTWPVADLSSFVPKAIVIGSSTGGPAALERFFSAFRPPLKIPIFLCQHMPPVFTKQLATRIAQITGLPSEEGRNGAPVVPGQILVAPGDYHMTLKQTSKPDGSGEEVTVQLDQGPQVNSVRPAVDPLFETAANIYGRSLLAVVLTGMGEDGKNGAVAVRAAKGVVVIQDAASCTVFGMPRAVYEAQACDGFGTPEELGALCVRLVTPLTGHSLDWKAQTPHSAKDHKK